MCNNVLKCCLITVFTSSICFSQVLKPRLHSSGVCFVLSLDEGKCVSEIKSINEIGNFTSYVCSYELGKSIYIKKDPKEPKWITLAHELASGPLKSVYVQKYINIDSAYLATRSNLVFEPFLTFNSQEESQVMKDSAIVIDNIRSRYVYVNKRHYAFTQKGNYLIVLEFDPNIVGAEAYESPFQFFNTFKFNRKKTSR